MNSNYIKYKKKFHEDGFVIIKNFISKSDISYMKKDLEFYKLKKMKEFSGRDINFTKDGSVNSIHLMDNWNWAKRIQNNKKLKSLAKVLLNSTPKNYGSELFAKPAKTGLKVPLHQDNYYWCIDDANALTFWISLEKSSKKNGGIYFYKGSNKLGILEHEQSFAPGSSQQLKYPEGMKNFKKVCPNLTEGDCVIHHVLTVHGSEPNKSNFSRAGLTIRYISNKSGHNKEMQMRYLAELNNQIKRRKNARIRSNK